MYTSNNHNLIDCAIIKVDSTRMSNSYLQDGSANTYGYNYTVRVEDIEQTMKFIKEVFKEFNMPCSRIYLSGFACLTEDYIWTKQRIVNQVKNESIRLAENTKTSSLAR